jgi:hypothetical protein
VLVLLTPRWSQGSGRVALLWLVIVPNEVHRVPTGEARVAWPSSLRSSRLSRLLWVS